jgi:hypothetical protein
MFLDHFAFPVLVGKVFYASMKMMLATISSHFVFSAIDRESGIADSIAVPAHGTAEIRVTIQVGLERIETQIYIRQIAIAIGNIDIQ